MVVRAFDEAKTPLTLDNIQRWARDRFPDAFAALPSLESLSFIDVDDVRFERAIYRSLGRSAPKKLLIVGAYAPGTKVEDAEICAHIHAGDGLVDFFRVNEYGDGDFELQTVKTNGAIAFHPPFSDVGDDTGNGKAITRVEAVISYYFLAAGYLQEVVRYQKYASLFAKAFEQACRWIENGGEWSHRAITAPNARLSSGAATENSPAESRIVKCKLDSPTSQFLRSLIVLVPALKIFEDRERMQPIKREREQQCSSEDRKSALPIPDFHILDAIAGMIDLNT
jgi:hypothetical protein